MNAETALWGTFTPARALGQGGIVAVREGDEWRGGVVRHSANVTYCLFRGGGRGRGLCTRLHVAWRTKGMMGSSWHWGSIVSRRYSHNREIHPPNRSPLPPSTPSSSLPPLPAALTRLSHRRAYGMLQPALTVILIDSSTDSRFSTRHSISLTMLFLVSVNEPDSTRRLFPWFFHSLH